MVIPCAYAPYCIDTFATKWNLTRHCDAKHGGKELPFCKVCQGLVIFKNAAQLAVHDAKVHGLRSASRLDNGSSSDDQQLDPDPARSQRVSSAVAPKVNTPASVPSQKRAQESFVQQTFSKKKKLKVRSLVSRDGANSAVATGVVRCVYSPACPKSYASKKSMLSHCVSKHRQPGRLFCNVCSPEVMFFETSKQLRAHMMCHAPRKDCDLCGQSQSRHYFNKHRKTCGSTRRAQLTVKATKKTPLRLLFPTPTTASSTSSPISTIAVIGQASISVEDGCEADSPVSADVRGSLEIEGFSNGKVLSTPSTRVPVPKQFPKTQFTRSSHKAPKAELAKKVFAEYYQWLRDESPSHREDGMSATPDQHFNKFRTVVGKISGFLGATVQDTIERLSDGGSCGVLLGSPRMDTFFESLKKSDKHVKLKKVSVYKYLFELHSFLQWQFTVKRVKRLSSRLTELSDLIRRLSKQKKRERDPDQKRKLIEALPSVPAILEYMNGQLLAEATKAAREYKLTGIAKWSLYQRVRDYILVMLLFGVQPQRLQIYKQLTSEDVSYIGETTVLTVKEHKTLSVYGPVIIAIPPTYKKMFQWFLQLRSGIAASTEDNALFLDGDGKQENYLTSRLKQLMMNKFGIPVNVRDCRSMYVSHYAPMMSVDQRMALARSMYHSYEVQTQIYLCSDSTKTAISTSSLMQKIAHSARDDVESTGTSQR